MKENIYFRILKIYNNNNKFSFILKNLLDKVLRLEIDKKIYNLEPKDDIQTEIIDSINITINIIEEDLSFDINLSHYKNKNYGFDGDCQVETKNKPLKISQVNKGDLILDSNGDNLLVKNVIVSVVDKNNKLILINKSKCGMNLPYSNLIMSIKNNLKIKKVTLKGRSLFLNGKAEVFYFDDKYLLYSLETEGKNDFLLNGFIVESI